MIRNKRAKFTALMMAGALAMMPLMGSGALAIDDWNLAKNATDLTWVRPSAWSNRKITAVASSDPSVLTVGNVTNNSQFTVTPIKAGTTTLTISYYTDDISNSTNETQRVNVTDGNSALTFSANGQTQVPGTQSFTSLGTIVSQNTNVATVTLNASGQLAITSVGPGSTRITGTGSIIGGNSLSVTYDVTVAGTATSTTTGSINGTAITVPKGQTFQIPGTYYTITSLSSSSPTVATALASGFTGSMTMSTTGLAVGTTVLTGIRTTTAGGTSDSFTYTVTVTDGTTTTAGTGISLTTMNLQAGGFLRAYNANGSNFVEVDSTSIQSSNASVATGTLDGTNAVKVTAVSAGTANITFKARLIANGAWNTYTIPVTVTGTSSATATNSDAGKTEKASTNAITFKKSSYSLPKSTKGAYVLKGMQLEGNDMEAADLFWVSTDTSVVLVNSQSGAFKVLSKTGEARLIAVDETGESMGSVLIKAK